ncbi:MAG: stage V sporulation protein AA [Bacillus sp. (in: firmicutes)]
MGEMIYVRMHHRVNVEGRKLLYLRDIAKIIGPPHIVGKLQTLHIYEITPSDRNIIIIDFITIVEKILQAFEGIDIQSIGPAQMIVEVKPKRIGINKLLFITVWLLLFVGAALTIMNYHEDVSMRAVHMKIYTLITGKEVDKPLLLQIPYSIGLGLGMVLFFNHFFKKRFNEEPSPLEVEMFNYQQDLDQYVMMNENKESLVEIHDHSRH